MDWPTAAVSIAAIIAVQTGIVKLCHRQRLQLHKSKQFSSQEIAYAGKVFDNLLDGCRAIIGQLLTLTTDSGLQMKDDERIKNIDGLYDDMQKRYQFIRHFGNENNVLAMQRMMDQNDVRVLKEVFGQ